MSDQLLQDIEDLDVQTSAQIEHHYKALAAAILALLAIVGPGGLGLYYTMLFNALVRELDTFKNSLLASVDKAFEMYWAAGIQSGLDTLQGMGIDATSFTGGLDKTPVRNYIVTVASGTATRLQETLKANLQRSLLQGADSERDVKLILAQLSEMARNEGMVNVATLNITSQLLAAATMAQRGVIDAFLDQNPSKESALEKTWHWSHVQRPNHAMMDGVTVPYNEKFHVPGNRSVPSADMSGPHDPSAPVGQTANCKCFMSVSVKKGAK